MAGADPRLVPARPDLAAARLRGVVAAARYAEGVMRRVRVARAVLREGPGPARAASELLFGEEFEVFEEAEGRAWGQALRDSYVGWVDAAALGACGAVPTHRVAVPLAHLYPRPDVRAPDPVPLPFGARLAVTGAEGVFLAAEGGFVPAFHLAPLGSVEADPVAVAERFLGAPYLWGGRTWLGIDCSGLVQLALTAAGRPCPRDSDLQAAGVGRQLGAEEALGRGDLVFWRGHVGMMRDGETLLHANAHHMAVASEPLAAAAARIAASGGGPVICRRRP